MSKSLESTLHNLVRRDLDASDLSYCGITKKRGWRIASLPTETTFLIRKYQRADISGGGYPTKPLI